MRKKSGLYGMAAVLMMGALPVPLLAQQGARTTHSVAGQYRLSSPTRWKVSSRTPNALELFIPPVRSRKALPAMQDDESRMQDDESRKRGGNVAAEATMLIVVEPRRNHDEALRRLEEIAAEQPEEPRKLLIGGWPAIERTFRAPLPVTGEDDENSGTPQTTFVTTAIAAGSSLVRLETTLQPDADMAIAGEALRIGRTVRPPAAGRTATSNWELEHLRVRFTKTDLAPRQDERPVPSGAARKDGGAPSPGVAVPTQTDRGELEVLVTSDGRNVVVAANPRFSRSTTSGATWTSTDRNPCNQTSCDGDPSLAIGQSGAMYFAWMGGPSPTQRGNGISRSTDNGQTFPFRALAVSCPGASACQVADQEHLASDRFNAGASGDLVYNVWRNFTGPTTLSSIRIVCSSDGGSTWGRQLVIGAGDFPRVAVAPDGFVYVASHQGSNMMLTKFSACNASNDLTQQTGFPVTVAAFVNVACPVPGLDRCNDGNILASPTVAPDDLDPSHIYYAFATQTVAGNEDVMLRDSTDGGATFPRSVRINANVTGRRFMPWISAYGGVAALSWYDRRFATIAQNDSTRFFIGTAKPNGPALVALTETDLSGISDQQCSTWPRAPRARGDSTSCSAQPQLAGVCSVSTFIRCDFLTGGCPAGETCNTGGGAPKYGDYNGNAAASGRFYSAWSSAVAPTGTVAPGAGINVYNSVDRIPSDFFIRDWTNNTTTHDLGNQPSTNSVFWTSSDVWNQSTSAPLPLVNDWIGGDPPTRTGPNFALARVSRRAAAMPAAPSATATVRFAFADFGAGAVFSDLGTENVTFAAGDMTKFTPGHAWTVPPSASGHICLVAQLSAPDGDAFAPPSLIGTAASGGVITADNNKAQRNLSVLDAVSGSTAEMFAMVRNDRIERRPVRLRVTDLAGVPASISIGDGKSAPLEKRMLLDAGVLGPGEARWVQLRFTNVPKDAKLATVVFADDAPGGSGFSIGVAAAPLEIVAARNLRAFANLLLRMASLESNDDAQGEAAQAFGLVPEERVDAKTYSEYLKAHVDAIGKLATEHLSRAQSDPVGIGEALQRLRNASAQGDIGGTTGALNALTERLDVHLTMLLRAAG